MARRSIHRLSDRRVKTAPPGMHCDGGGLYLQITQGADGTPRRSWLYRYVLHGRERQMGLGSLNDTTLAEAREKAAVARKQRVQGDDPIDTKRAQRASAALARAKAMSFDQCRDAYIAAHRAGWRNAKHAAQWTSTLEAYVTPVFGQLPVGAIDTGLVTKALEPIWAAKTETASRVRGRIECILDWAKARGFRNGENPARWRGHLDSLLPARSKVRRVEHHAALPFSEIGAFMAQLREQSTAAARALEFTILTAARTGEVLGACWDEIDRDAAVWTIPPDRMKGAREHRVPLSAAALAVIEQMHSLRENDYVFPGDRRDRLSDRAMDMLLRRMGREVTVHGFRSSFRDWAAECTHFPREVAEAALAHAVGDKVEAAYRQGDLFAKRQRLMSEWAGYCYKTPASGTVISLHASAQ
jgi:integrase